MRGREERRARPITSLQQAPVLFLSCVGALFCASPDRNHYLGGQMRLHETVLQTPGAPSSHATICYRSTTPPSPQPVAPGRHLHAPRGRLLACQKNQGAAGNSQNILYPPTPPTPPPPPPARRTTCYAGCRLRNRCCANSRRDTAHRTPCAPRADRCVGWPVFRPRQDSFLRPRRRLHHRHPPIAVMTLAVSATVSDSYRCMVATVPD